jgi:hypothetical protein
VSIASKVQLKEEEVINEVKNRELRLLCRLEVKHFVLDDRMGTLVVLSILTSTKLQFDEVSEAS